MRTVAAMWREAAAASRAYPAYLVHDGGGWREVSWLDAAAAVDEVAAGLLDLGVGRGDRVALISSTRLEWAMCDLALASIGAVSVPVYPTSSAHEIEHVLGDAAVRAVVCEDAALYAVVAPLRADVGSFEIVTFDGEPGSATRLEELRERGRRLLARRPAAVDELRDAIGEDDLLTIIYTSGTTGSPKGCMLSHRHYRAMVEMIGAVPGLFAGADRVLLYLPLAHTFARLVEYAGVGVGFTVALCPDVGLVQQALVDVRPTILPSVPRLFEKVYEAVTQAFASARGPRRRLVDWALATGRLAAARRCRGERLPPLLAVRHALADALVYRKVKAKLGGCLRLAISGGAPLAVEVAELFAALDVLVLEGYGLTEFTTASHVNQPARHRFGSVGLPLAGVEARVADDGELLLRGETVFAGYWRDAEATARTVDEDGWLHTGDVGEIDADGFLTITDRKKDIIVTAGGKNVAPQNLERALVSSPYVAQAVVVGDRRPFITALLVPDRARLALAAATPEEQRAQLERVVADVNRRLGRTEQIRRFAVLDRELGVESGELTPTLKVRRHVCEERFAAEIDALYASLEAPPADET